MVSYSFSNLCGAPYRGGHITFTSDGRSLLSPVGNRVSVFDLQNNFTVTLGCENRKDIHLICIHPDSQLAVTIDLSGHALVIHVPTGNVLQRIQFHATTVTPSLAKQKTSVPSRESENRVSAASFSPNGLFFAVTIGRKLQIWNSPTFESGWQMTLHRTLVGHVDVAVSLDWSADSLYIVTASRDMTVRLWSREPIDGFEALTFVDHRNPVKAAYFTKDMLRIISVSRDGAIICWFWNANSKQTDTKVPSCGKVIRPFSLIQSNLKKKFEGDLLSKKAKQTEHTSIYNAFKGKWEQESKSFCNENLSGRVLRAAFHSDTGILVIGFTNGVFRMYMCPDMSSLYSMSITGGPIDSLTINNSGEWIAIGSAETGQLLVWEWKSETHILKQQGHHHGINSLAFSPVSNLGMRIGSNIGRDNKIDSHQGTLQSHGVVNSQIVATGGYDGKLKLWNTQNGFCFATFAEHTAPVMDICFTPQANAILTASLDGSVRAFDLLRYRNFRTFASPRAGVQFTCIACDCGGEVVVAGSQGSEYSIFVWSIQTGNLLDTLSGHEGPVVSLNFHPHPSSPGVLASASWDKSVRIWDIFASKVKSRNSEALTHSTSVLCLAFDPRGNGKMATAIMSGYITFWNIEDAQVVGTIEGIRDIQSGRRPSDRFAANNFLSKRKAQALGPNANFNQNQHYNSICYSFNGQWLIASSQNSARVNLYNTDSYILCYKYQLTHNLSLDGILQELDSRYMTESGIPLGDYDLSDTDDAADIDLAVTRKRKKNHESLPGATIGEAQIESAAKSLKVWQCRFSADSRQWAASTSHGLFVYSIDLKGGSACSFSLNSISCNANLLNFTPQILTKNVTKGSIESCLSDGIYGKAFILALALNDYPTLLKAYESVPYSSIPLVTSGLALPLLPQFFNFMRVMLTTEHFVVSRHLQVHLAWLQSCLLLHMNTLEGNSTFDVQKENDTGPQRKFHVLADFAGLHNADIRTIFLLILRQLQRRNVIMSKLYNTNLQTLRLVAETPRDSAFN